MSADDVPSLVALDIAEQAAESLSDHTTGDTMTTYETHLDLAREQHEAERARSAAIIDAEAALLDEARRGRLAEHGGVWDEDWMTRLRTLIDADLAARGDLAPSPWRTAS